MSCKLTRAPRECRGSSADIRLILDALQANGCTLSEERKAQL